MGSSFYLKSLASMSKRMRTTHNYNTYNSHSRHFSWFGSKSSDNTKAETTRVQVILAPEMLPDGPDDNVALIVPKGEQQMIQFKDINPVLSHRAFIKNVTMFDAAIEKLLTGADKITPQQLFDEIDYHYAYMKYSLSLAHVLTNAHPSEYKFGVLDDMYNSFLKHEVYRFNPLTYHTACEIIDSTSGSRSDDSLKQLAQLYLSQGKLYGLHLNPSIQKEVADHYVNIKKRANTYISNVNKCMQNEAVLISDEKVIKALPESFVSKIFTKAGIKLPMHPTAYNIFMTHCPDKLTRRRVWVAFNSKPQMAGGVNNSVEFENLRDYRHKLANTLGYVNYAEMAVSRKMAGSLEVVRDMIDSIHERTRHKFNADLQEIEESKGHASIGKVELWDLSFLKANALKKKFGAKIDVARYFPLEKVVSGTFQLIENLFDVHIEQVQSDKCQTWSPHVKFYRMVDNNGEVLGHFYFDPYNSRAGDSYGSNIIELTNRTKTLGTTPLCAAFLSKKLPIAQDQQILLSYPEFLSFLSMMGRILTILMTNENYYELSTFYNISKDRMDSLGHLLLLYGLHNYETIQLCSGNITNGEALPLETHQLLRQYILGYESFGLTNDLFLSILDVALYTNTEFWRDIQAELWTRYVPNFDLPKEYAFPLSFNEIVTNDGAAGYYSRIWSQMIASDICAKFLESGSNTERKAVGKKLRETLLSSNSSSLSADLFRQFRGRDPSILPFLELHDLEIQPKLS